MRGGAAGVGQAEREAGHPHRGLQARHRGRGGGVQGPAEGGHAPGERADDEGDVSRGVGPPGQRPQRGHRQGQPPPVRQQDRQDHEHHG